MMFRNTLISDRRHHGIDADGLQYVLFRGTYARPALVEKPKQLPEEKAHGVKPWALDKPMKPRLSVH